MKFNSQICTTREQSERLLALGLKKETADMYYRFYDENTYEIIPTWDTIWEDMSDYKKIIPEWSLHRLIEMIDGPEYIAQLIGVQIANDYDYIVDCIEWLIKEGYFNKEYLV